MNWGAGGGDQVRWGQERVERRVSRGKQEAGREKREDKEIKWESERELDRKSEREGESRSDWGQSNKFYISSDRDKQHLKLWVQPGRQGGACFPRAGALAL